MGLREKLSVRTGGGWIAILLFAFALWMLPASRAQADDCVADRGGIIDGYIDPVPPSQIQIDGNCTIRNFPASNPLTSNISFLTRPGQTNDRWLVIFDNVVHTGQMSCDAVQGHKIWFVNGSSSGIHQNCQNQLIPVEKINKQNPAGQTTATVGVPFTYKLTIPILYDPATGNTIDFTGSPNDLHSIVVWDDLNATGVDLSYVSHTVYWKSDGTPVPHTFSNVGGLLTFTFDPSVIIPATQQVIIEITVVLDDTPTNVLGTQFINTAKWQFGRLIDGVFYTPLPGEWGVSPPMTIAAPNLVVTKTGPATMNLGEWGQFGIDVQNTGLSDAWNVTLLDRLPDGSTGGMCDVTPQVLSAQVFEADGVTPVPGKGPLVPGTDFSLSYNGAPTCELTLNVLTAAGVIGPNQRLIVTYRTQLDADSQNGATLTNVAGAIRWFNGDSSNANRQAYTRTLTNGTVGTLDHEDAHTVTVALSGYFFEKTVANLTSGVNPTTTAAPGNRLRYTLRLRTTDTPLNNLTFRDDMGALNASAVFVPGSLTLVSVPNGADTSNTNPNGGTNGAGILDIRNLHLPANSEIQVQFDITLSSGLPDGTVVTNQADLTDGGVTLMKSDDPNVNGQADPSVTGDEDPTRVVIHTAVLFEKTVADVTTGANPATQARPGDTLRYTLRIQNLASAPLGNFALSDELDRLNSTASFAAGTLTLISVPAGADTSNTNATGGMKGTGLVDIRNLTLGANATLQIVYEIKLAAVIANGSAVLNQAQMLMSGTVIDRSDDPNINGPADPNIFGDEDPTRVTILSAPAFQVLKTAADLTGDPNVLLAGETLRYTITVRNIGNDNATDVTIRDQVPANTAYVAGSTTLNGAPVADVSGRSPLIDGMSINAPGEAPGSIRADTSTTQTNVATITFEVVVNADVADGTVISNQAFVSAPAGGVYDRPSDDPGTPVLDDPTRNVVGNYPLLFAEKKVVLLTDAGSPNIVDPGDVLRYTITVYNTGKVAATGAMLSDSVPANTTYVANSLHLNGLAVGQPDGGVSPLIAGINISSSDLTPPVPGAGQGTLSPGQSAVIQFDLRVNDGVPSGTLISNQAVVRTTQVPYLLTDGDGNPATGPEPTVVVVGSGQQLSITKQVAVVGGGPAVAGGQLEYLVRVTNISPVPAFYVVITDDLSTPVPGRLTFVDNSATLNGSTGGISIAGSVLTADYSGTYGPLQPGQSISLRFRASIAANLPIGTTVTNTAVVKWNNPPQTAKASVSIDVGGIPGVGILNGTAWHDANFNKTADASERRLEGWTVELYRNDRLVYSALTDVTGTYRISGVAPNYVTGDRYELRFTAPGAGPNTAKLGKADSNFTNDLQRITDIIVQSGSNLQNLNLPIEPNGVVYNSMTRAPIAGAALRMLHAGAALPVSCFYDPAQQNQITLTDGYYRFDINFSDPACPSGGSYVLEVTAPASGYVAGYSQIIPPTSDASTAPFSVPACPGSADDAIPATAQRCEVQVSEFAPPPSVRARSVGTRYYVNLTLDDSLVPGSSQIFNNHIPLDPQLGGALSVTKTTPLLNVARGQLVPYSITLRNVVGLPLQDVRVVDRFPAGFHYVPGSARIDGKPTEPTAAGRELMWSDLSFGSSDQHTIVLLLAVGAGVSEGEFVNRAQAVHGLTGNALSGEASATVRVVPDPTFDCTDVTGKVFDDVNRNGLQDAGERGLPGVRLVTARGLVAVTDAYGRFHITCAITPVEGRGSNFILKLDDRTLPSGYRPSTEPVRVERATRGKTLRFNFGASIHHVVGLDLADAVFEPGTTDLRVQWQPRIELLLDELRKSPSVLRLSYLADVEDAQLVDRRLNAIRQEIMDAWKAMDCCYPLAIESEVFWRRGSPPKHPAERARASR